MIKVLYDASNDPNFKVEFQRAKNMLKFGIWREMEKREQLSAEYACQVFVEYTINERPFFLVKFRN